MLNQSLPQRHFPSPARINPELAHTEWCVGDGSSQWDVSFADRLMAGMRKLFSRAQGPEPLKMNPEKHEPRRKAA